MTAEERVASIRHSLVLIQAASAADDRALATPRELLAAVSVLAGKAVEALDPLRQAPTDPQPDRVPLRTSPLTREERAGSREALTLRARLEAAHNCGNQRKGFVQLPRSPSGVREWTCQGCDAIVTLPVGKDSK